MRQGRREARRSLATRFWILQLTILLTSGIGVAFVYRWLEYREVDRQLTRQLHWLRDDAGPPYTMEHMREEFSEIAVGAERGWVPSCGRARTMTSTPTAFYTANWMGHSGLIIRLWCRLPSRHPRAPEFARCGRT